MSSPIVSLPRAFAPSASTPNMVDRWTQNDIYSLQNQVATLNNDMVKATSTLETVTANHTPAICTSVAAVESPYKTSDGSMKSLVSVSYVNIDPLFASVNIYLTGYHGSTTPQIAASGLASPVSFLCETTHETLTVTVVAVGTDGTYLPITEAPTCTVSLDGVVSAPPPPSISSGLVLTALGYTFSFNAESGLLQDVVAGYNVYRNTSHTFTGATQIQHIAQPPTNTGSIQVQDVLPTNTTIDYFYYVTAVNTSGLESTPTDVGLATSGGVPEQVTAISAVESPYKTSDGTMLSLVAVDFTPVSGDPYFASVNIYFIGYNGNATPQLMSNASVSPAQFLCQTTHESVQVQVVAVSASGTEAPLAGAPICYVTLDGVVSAPPAPSIAQAQVALDANTGWQFTFNVIGGLEFDQIQCYRVYHSESNVTPTPPNNYYRTIPQPNTNIGEEVVQEVSGDILYYWVSSVNTAGLESVLEPVPFTYIDPGSPPPSTTPVVTTKNYYPTTLLNGWGTSAHVGFWETQDSITGLNFGLSSTQVCQPFLNPSSAFDGNQTTAASWSDTHAAGYAGCVWSFASFPGLAAGATATSIALSITSDVLQTAGPVHGEASIYYSLDNGSTWTQVYLASYQITTNPVRPKQTDTVTIATSVNPTQIQVMACVHSHDDIAMDVYEISLAIASSSVAGPSAVTGVTASLVTGDVQISWNGLVPLTRTDILNYYVYRALHGAGYQNSHLEATITPTGIAIYSWIDTAAHDGSWDYWVIAGNSTGYSPASNTACLTSATSTLYVSGVTLESLKPAEVAAEQTTGKSIDLLVDGTVYSRIPKTIYGSTGTAIDLVGNIKLKNAMAQPGVTYNPSISSSWADLPELGSGNALMNISLHGNPILFGITCSFQCGTGASGEVTGISWSPSSFSVTNGSGPPTISISLSGGGGVGGGISVGWSNSGSYPNFTWTPYLNVTPGSGYTSAPTATVVITNGNGPYYNGTNTYSCTIGTGTPAYYSGQSVSVQLVTSTGYTLLGPLNGTTDAYGNVSFSANSVSFIFSSPQTLYFKVQAMTTSGYPIVCTSRVFNLVELG